MNIFALPDWWPVVTIAAVFIFYIMYGSDILDELCGWVLHKIARGLWWVFVAPVKWVISKWAA